MKNPVSHSARSMVLITIAFLLGLSIRSQAQVVFSDDFDGILSSTVTAAPVTTNGYKILFAAASGPVDYTATFGYDYSANSIPPAPNSVGGTTKGLYLSINKDATGANSWVNLYPTNQSFSGNFSLKFDLWVNWGGTAGTTEAAVAGINHSGNVTNKFGTASGTAGSDGIFFTVDGDGGASATSATLRDYSIFRGGGTGAPVLLLTNNTTFGPAPLLGNQFSHGDAGFLSLFPSAGPAGTAGNSWVTGEIRQETNVITWFLNGTIVAQFTNNTAYGSGDIMIGYSDPFGGSIGAAAVQFAIFDNISVTMLGGPPTVSVTNSIPTATEGGASGRYTFIRTGDTSGPLTVFYTMGGTAGNGDDYQFLDGSITFLPGASVTNLLLTPVDDSTSEPLETAVLNLASDSSYAFGTPSSATVSIIDNDPATVSIASAQPVLLEGISAARVPLTITRIGLTNSAITVNLGYTGTATRGADYNSAASISVPAGAVTASINMTPINDNFVEGPETATVSLLSGSGYVIGASPSVDIAIVDDDVLPGNTLFADTFDSAGSLGNWIPNSAGPDTHMDFGYDYSVDGIPEAPSSPLGSAARHGLKLHVGETVLAVGGLSLSPTNGDFEGSYRLLFDMWLSYAGPLNSTTVPGQTQAGTAGVGVTGVEPMLPAPTGAASAGIWFAATGDGGSGTTSGDYNAYAASTLFDDSTGIYGAGFGTGVRDNVNPYYAPWPGVTAPASVLAARPTQSGSTPAGAFGSEWHKVEITKRADNNMITWKVDGRLMASVDYSGLTFFVSTNVFIGYYDPFATAGTITTNAACQFGLFDNVRVETLSRPLITSLTISSGQAVIDFTAEEADSPFDFEVQAASTVDGLYVPVAGGIGNPAPGKFEATVPASGSPGFFRVHRL